MEIQKQNEPVISEYPQKYPKKISARNIRVIVLIILLISVAIIFIYLKNIKNTNLAQKLTTDPEYFQKNIDTIDCTALSDKNDPELGDISPKDFCISTRASILARRENNPELCSEINIDQPYGEMKCRDGVYSKLANDNKDINQCLKIKSDSDKNKCIENIASLTGDISICKMQTYFNPYVCVNKALTTQGAMNGDASVCARMTNDRDKSTCYGELGVSLKNPELCELAGDSDSFAKPSCYMGLAKVTKDPKYCKKLSAFGNWESECEQSIKK